jgi:hypothetical protein
MITKVTAALVPTPALMAVAFFLSLFGVDGFGAPLERVGTDSTTAIGCQVEPSIFVWTNFFPEL